MTPSIEDLNTLKSTLSSHKAQLDTLIKQQPTNDSPQLQTAISRLQNSVQALESNITDVEKALTAYNQAKDTLTNALKTQTLAQRDAEDKRKIYNSSLTSHEATKQQLAAQKTAQALAQAQLAEATQKAQEAQELLTNLTAALTQQQEASAQALQTLNERQANAITAQATLTQAQQALSNAQAQKAQAEQNYSDKTSNEAQARLDLNNAQHDYDTKLIPDPTWTAPTYQKENTRLVPYTEIQLVRTLVPRTTTTLQEQVIPNLLPNPTLTSTEGWSGVYPGWQGSQPGMYDGEITFSYMDQTVTQGLYSGPFENATLTLSADWYSDWTADSYSMTVTAEDINRNPVGTATYTNTRTAHDWTNRSVTLEATGPVSYITISFSGIDHGFWYGMYGPRMKNPALEVSYGQYVTETTYEEVITYEEVTKYREEIYYTTETIQPQQGLTVRVYNQLPTSNPLRSDTAYNLCKTTTLTSINHDWGGGDILGCGSDRVMLHYTGYITPTENITSLRGLADDGFYLDINGVNAINNWTLKGCGGNWNPVNLQAGQSYAIDAWFYEWGGGACSILNYQSASGEGVVPEAWYSNGASAPLIKDPALLPALQAAQIAHDQALSELQQSQLELEQSQESLASSVQTSNEATQSLITANSQLQTAEDLYSTESGKSQALQTSNEAAQRSLEAASGSKTQAQQELTTQEDLLATATSNEAQAKIQVDLSQADLTSADKTSAEASVSQQKAQEGTDNSATSFQSSLEVASAAGSAIPDLIKEATEIYETPQGSPEVPTNLTAENLQEIDLSTIDPTELSPEQATLLVTAALETFETATEGSPEYEQALDALFLAAQQDDIVVDESLAAIPGVGEAAKAVVAIFNIVGNVGADISPEKRKEAQTLVVTTLVVGQIAQTAAIASASAGSSFRRK